VQVQLKKPGSQCLEPGWVEESACDRGALGLGAPEHPLGRRARVRGC
jgi:hypothetical protein